MAVQVKAIEYRIAQRHKAEKAITRKEQTERARLLAPWRNSAVPADERVPVCYLRFMLECGLLVDGHGTLTGCTMVDCHDDANADLDESQPWVLMFDMQGPGKDMSMLRAAIGEKRIDDAISKAEAYLNEDGSRVTCDSRFVPLGGGQDTVEELTWVPRAWRSKSQTPEFLRSIGTPWLLSSDITGARKDAVHWPVPGFAHILCAQRGDMLACLIPGEPAIERGSTLASCVTFLSLLPWKDFQDFMRTHSLFAKIVPGRALWVPYGWRCILVTREQLSHSHALHIPYINTRMLCSSLLKVEILNFAKRANREWGDIMAQEPCVSLANEAEHWLDKVSTVEYVAASPMHDTPMAIEDEQY